MYHFYKTLFPLRARTLATQKAEARVACSVINRMTKLGMPLSQRVRQRKAASARVDPSFGLMHQCLFKPHSAHHIADKLYCFRIVIGWSAIRKVKL
jgi:hypothetical protein